MRVIMVVVMVLSQHEKVDYVRVVPESIRKIGWKWSNFRIAFSTQYSHLSTEISGWVLAA